MKADDFILDKRPILGRHEFFHGAPAAVLDRIAAHTRLVSYSPGQSIFRKGDQGLGLLIVISGIIKISAPSPDGKEIVLNLISPNEICGELALLDGEPRTADATAVTNCLVLALDRRDFLGVLRDEPSLSIRLLAIVSRRLRRTSEQVEDLALSCVAARLAKALWRLAEIQEIADAEEPRIAITQKELGRAVGLSRESTNRHLRRWERAGLIEIEKCACIIKDRHSLMALAEGG